MKVELLAQHGMNSRLAEDHGRQTLRALRSRRRTCSAGIAWLGSLLLCAGIALIPGRTLRAATSTNQQVLQGTLITVPGTGPVLSTKGKKYPLAGRNQYIFHTLEDKRLQKNEVRLEGELRPDGNFQVDRFYTVHNGKLYRVRYFCETCNIAALEPGICVCCQQPTELQEVPVNEHDKNILITR